MGDILLHAIFEQLEIGGFKTIDDLARFSIENLHVEYDQVGIEPDDLFDGQFRSRRALPGRLRRNNKGQRCDPNSQANSIESRFRHVIFRRMAAISKSEHLLGCILTSIFDKRYTVRAYKATATSAARASYIETQRMVHGLDGSLRMIRMNPC